MHLHHPIWSRLSKWASILVGTVHSDVYARPTGHTNERIRYYMHIDVAWDRILRPNTIARFRAHKNMDRNVATLRIFPGITESAVRAFLAPPIRGIVLETYGAGNVPTVRKELLQAFEDATARGVVIVNCSQCKST
jgi:lysophospholipase